MSALEMGPNMDAIGGVATALAHELNQPIGASANLLRGLRSRLVRRNIRLEAEERAALDRAIEQVLFAAQVIRRMRELAQSQQPTRTKVDLTAMLRASERLLAAELGASGVQLVLELPEAPIQVNGDHVTLQQVVVNLLKNARDALVTDRPAEPRIVLRLAATDDQAEIQVNDNGCGLPEDAAERLFKPGCSTKSSGLGIGLALCRSFVQLNEGSLAFSRNPDRGTTFHIRLPRSAS